MITNEIVEHKEKTPVIFGLSVKEISDGISALVQEGARNHIVGPTQDLDSKYAQKREEKALSALKKEIEESFDHGREIEIHPVQSGLVKEDGATSLKKDLSQFTVAVRIPLHTETILDTAVAHVDRVYLVDLDEKVRNDLYEHASERLGVDMQNPASDTLYILEKRHDPQFLHRVNGEVAKHLLSAWYADELQPHTAFTEISKVKNTPPSR